MAGLKDLRNRISAIKSTEKITSAMKMVAASKLRSAQNLLSKSEAYRSNLYVGSGRVLTALKRETLERGTPLVLPDICMPHPENKKYLLVIISSDRGLCGSYNMMIARAAMNRIEELKAAGKEVKVICLGQRGYNALKRNYADIIVRNAESPAAGGVFYDEAVALAWELREMFVQDEIDACEIVYSRFKSALARDTLSQQVLPFDLATLFDPLPPDREGDAYYEVEPDSDKMFKALVPQVFREFVFDIMINSQASEQSARMTSMDNATRNAGDIISKLTLKYNRIRQTEITTELVEIIAGAEAV